jgi:hypothetical protein
LVLRVTIPRARGPWKLHLLLFLDRLRRSARWPCSQRISTSSITDSVEPWNAALQTNDAFHLLWLFAAEGPGVECLARARRTIGASTHTCKAVPYGVYDTAAIEGWISVSLDCDTPAFTVESIRRWWQRTGLEHHARPKACSSPPTRPSQSSDTSSPRAEVLLWRRMQRDRGRVSGETDMRVDRSTEEHTFHVPLGANFRQGCQRNHRVP